MQWGYEQTVIITCNDEEIIRIEFEDKKVIDNILTSSGEAQTDTGIKGEVRLADLLGYIQLLLAYNKVTDVDERDVLCEIYDEITSIIKDPQIHVDDCKVQYINRIIENPVTRFLEEQ